MAPRLAAHLLGLCNVVAGALVACAPVILMPGLDGLGSAGTRLLGSSLGIVLAAVGIGAWLMPADARRIYLWIFGVAVKGVAAAVWGAAAMTTGVTMLAAGAALDLAVALVIASMLRSAR